MLVTSDLRGERLPWSANEDETFGAVKNLAVATAKSSCLFSLCGLRPGLDQGKMGLGGAKVGITLRMSQVQQTLSSL